MRSFPLSQGWVDLPVRRGFGNSGSVVGGTGRSVKCVWSSGPEWTGSTATGLDGLTLGIVACGDGWMRLSFFPP